jgi:thioredoxin reductase (NADPH)
VAKTIVIGDGPAGLSAALFLAKNDEQVVVFGEDETAMHYAHLRNYLGVEEIDGSDFQEGARKQVAAFGASLREQKVTEVDRSENGFVVRTDDGAEETADYVLLAGGRALARLAEQIGAEVREGAVVVDTDARTSVDRLYAAGRIARPNRSQAIISAGAGATAALDILSREAGRDVTDWDTPED